MEIEQPPSLPKHVICHLRISLGGDGQPPTYQPFEESELSLFSCGPCEPACAYDNPVMLLPEFVNKSSTEEWPRDTNVACFWCCHNFRTPPIGMPTSVRADGKFETTGCFCSLQCGLAHSLHEPASSSDSRWHRSALFNCMARKMYGAKSPITPAPRRETLSMFGGHLSIDEFRRASGDDVIIVDTPPMVSVPHKIVPVKAESLDAHRKYSGFVASATSASRPDTLVLKRSHRAPAVTPNNFFPDLST